MIEKNSQYSQIVNEHKWFDKKMTNIVKLYRLSNFFFRKGIPVLPFLIKWLIRIIYSADIPYQIVAGDNIHFAHSGLGIVIHPRVLIGNNVTIGQHVTIGGSMGKYGVPIIGDNVFISTGAKILGEIGIKNNVVVGANSVVTKSVPNNTVVGGVPAIKIREISDKEMSSILFKKS